jgi:hypothetical protein
MLYIMSEDLEPTPDEEATPEQEATPDEEAHIARETTHVKQVHQGFKPKHTQDTLQDYLADWASKTGKDPKKLVLVKVDINPSMENLRKLVLRFLDAQKLAATDKGKLVQGTPQLGISSIEYIPSASELVVSELGMALKKLVDMHSSEDMAIARRTVGMKPIELAFTQIIFSHADIIGSGRFFHASKGKEIQIKV